LPKYDLLPKNWTLLKLENWRGYDKMDMKLREKRKGSCPEGSSTRSLRSQP